METSIFWSGNSQAVRLPKDFRLQGSVADICRDGDKIVIQEKKAPSWKEIFAIECSEFELERPDNGKPQERDLF